MPRDFLADPRDYSRDQLVEPSLHNFTLKLYAMVYGIALLPAGFDQSFIDSLTVFVKGEGPAYDPEGARTIEFTDPFSKKVYVAILPEVGDERIPIAYTLVGEAARAATQYLGKPDGADRDLLGRQLRETVELLDMLRQLSDMYGYLSF